MKKNILATSVSLSLLSTSLLPAFSYAQVVPDTLVNGGFEDPATAPPPTPPAPTLIPTDGLVGYWTFDNVAGTSAPDSSGKGNNGIIAGGALVVPGKIGSGIQFDGVNDVINIPDSNSLDVSYITVSAWVKKLSPARTWGVMVGRQASNTGNLTNDRWNLYYRNNTADDYLFAVRSSSGWKSTPNGIPSTADQNVWVHLAGTYDGTTIRLYKNGAQISSTPWTGPLPGDTTPVQIAAENNSRQSYGPSEFVNAVIDEVRIYNRALSAAEVGALAGVTPGTGGTTDPVAYDWQNFGAGYVREAHPRTGNWGIAIRNSSNTQSNGAYQRIDLKQTSIKPVFIGSYVSGENIQPATGAYLGATLYAEIHLTNGTVAYWNTPISKGTFSWRWVGFNTGTLASVNQPIDHIFVVPLLAQAQGTAWFDDVRVTEFTPSGGVVTIMLDDGEDNAYDTALPILNEFGYPASVAVISNEIDAPGFLSASQLTSLQSEGWEIVSHGKTHEDLTLMTTATSEAELRDSKQTLQALGLTVKNFALPFGAYNSDILARGSAYYRSIRAYELGDNTQGTFPYDVKVRSIINTTTPDEIDEWLSRAAPEGRWELLTFHGIRTSGDDVYFTTPDTFREILERIEASGIPVVTYDGALDRFSVTP